jgi:hypothetical protein
VAFSDNKYNFAVFDGGSQVLSGKRKLCRVAWETGATAGNDLVLTNAGGDDLGTLKSEAANEYLSINHLQGMWVTDFTVTTIDGGKLYVQYE